MKNLNAFKTLIERYRSITIEEIADIVEETGKFYADDIAQTLTGFGSLSTCTLCNAVDSNCQECVHSIISNANDYEDCYCIYEESYENIKLAITPEELITAYRKRADYMENLLKENNL